MSMDLYVVVLKNLEQHLWLKFEQDSKNSLIYGGFDLKEIRVWLMEREGVEKFYLAWLFRMLFLEVTFKIFF